MPYICVTQGAVKNIYKRDAVLSQTQTPHAFYSTAALSQTLSPATLCDFLLLQGKIYGLWAVYPLTAGLEQTDTTLLAPAFPMETAVKCTTRTNRLLICQAGILTNYAAK